MWRGCTTASIRRRIPACVCVTFGIASESALLKGKWVERSFSTLVLHFCTETTVLFPKSRKGTIPSLCQKGMVIAMDIALISPKGVKMGRKEENRSYLCRSGEYRFAAGADVLSQLAAFDHSGHGYAVF